MSTAIDTPTPAAGAHTATARPTGELPLWRLYAMRFGYLVMAGGLAVYKWPGLIHHEHPWPLHAGLVTVMLCAMSILAAIGIRYPVRMLPILLFEVVWKLMWLGIVAVPQWLSHDMDTATADTAAEVLWVVIILAVIPWGYVARAFVGARGDRWR